MGIEDRDWYYERSRGSARVRKSGSPNFFHALVGVLVVVALVVMFVRSLRPPRLAAPAEPARVVLRYPEVETISTAQAQPAPIAPQSTTKATEMFRCVLNGRVIYEGPEDCRNWPQMKGNVEPPRSAPPMAQQIDSGPATVDVIYLCKAYSGGMHRSCSSGPTVGPEGRAWRGRAGPGKGTHRTAPTASHGATAATRAVQAGRMRGARGNDNNLDSQARQPHSGGMQDWIRQQRQQARDRQFRLRC